MRARSQSPSIKELLEALADEERREALGPSVVVPLHRNHSRNVFERPGHQQGGGHAETDFVPVGSSAHVPRSAPRPPLLPLPDTRDLASIGRHVSDRISPPLGLSKARHAAGLRLVLVMAGLVVTLPSALYLVAPSLDTAVVRQSPPDAPTARLGQRSIATASVTSVSIPMQMRPMQMGPVQTGPVQMGPVQTGAALTVPSQVPANSELSIQATAKAATVDQGRLAALAHARAALAGEPSAPAAAEIPPSLRSGETAPRPYVASPQPAEQSVLLIARGLALVEAGQLSAARMVFEQAGQSGSGQAALQAARLFDPAELSKCGIGPEAADVAKARHWYERAAALGVADARPLLARLPGN